MKTRFIPTGMTKYTPDIGDYKADLFEIYVDLDKMTAIFYTRKQSKPTWFYRFNSLDDMKHKINTTISSLMSYEDTKAERKEKRKLPHALKVGDVLASSWGYDQTNVNFYQITKLVGKHTVELKEVISTVVDTSIGVDYVAPLVGHFKTNRDGKDTLTKRVNKDYVKLSSYEYAYLWDGKPKYETAIGFGH